MWKLITCLSLLLTSTLSMASNQKLTLNDCHLDGIRDQVQCGTLAVPENYDQIDGKQLSINFAVLPAIDRTNKGEPLMFLAGGPGQAAVELAPMIRRMFNEVRKKHDIILVDQRGTGKSSPLACEEIDQTNETVYSATPEDFSAQQVSDCIAQYQFDLSQFTSENAVRDFDAVRHALGYEQVNLYGGSYGTRAALVYLRLFPQSLRSVVLDSVGPIEVPIGLFGQSAARSFELLLNNCEAESSCQQAYPNLKTEYHSLIKRLEESPVSLTIAHPRLGNETELNITKDKLIGTLRMQLYSMATRSLVPLVIHQAFLGNYMPLVGLIAQTDVENVNAMYIGLTFNIVCNEDVPRFTPEAIEQDADNSFGGNNSHYAWNLACPLWPKYQVPSDFYNPVTAQVPTLILSGNLDPVTPPSNGEHSANTLPNSRHIVVANAAHIVAGNGCAAELINEFIEELNPKLIDESCLNDLPKESFMTSINGNI